MRGVGEGVLVNGLLDELDGGCSDRVILNRVQHDIRSG